MQTNDFIPILLGDDINAYGMARAFNEKYGIAVDAYAEDQLAPTRFSKIVNVHLIPGFKEDPGFINYMTKLAKKYQDYSGKVILIACGDGYAELISKHKAFLEKTFVCPYVDYDLLKQLNSKENFYKLCDKYGLPYPETCTVTKKMYDDKTDLTAPFDFPVALKPTNSVEWLDVHFEGRKKAFTIHSQEEYEAIIGKIYDNGYTSDLIVQDFIPGDDSNMRVLNAYVDQNHQVKLMCMGHPLLEDPTPAAIGNYMAILPEFDEKVYSQIKKFLEAINYTGYANFDMKYDERDNTYKFFEINIRMGRSSFYVTLNGYNLASYVVDDYVNHDLATREVVYGNQDPSKYVLWLGIPKHIFSKYVVENSFKDEAMQLIKKHQYGTTVFYKKDMNPKRWLLLRYMFYRYNKRFKEFFQENKGRDFE